MKTILAVALICAAAPASADDGYKKVGDWEVKVAPDAMEDTPRTYARLFNGHEGFAVRCIKNQLSAVLILPLQAQNLKTTTLRYRIDKGEISERRAEAFGTMNLDIMRPEPMVYGLQIGKRIAFEFALADGSMRQPVFNARGAEKALEPLTKCGLSE